MEGECAIVCVRVRLSLRMCVCLSIELAEVALPATTRDDVRLHVCVHV